MLPSDSIGMAWRTLANFSCGAAPTLRLSEPSSTSSGCGVFERAVAAAQGVVFGVRNGGSVVVEIALVVLGDLGAEPLVLFSRVFQGKL